MAEMAASCRSEKLRNGKPMSRSLGLGQVKRAENRHDASTRTLKQVQAGMHVGVLVGI